MYQELQSSVKETLADVGQLLTFSRKVGGSPDPNTGTITASTTSTFDVYGAVFDYTNKDAGVGTLEGSTIKIGDKRIIIEAGDYTPKLNDSVVVGSKTFTVKSFTEINPAGVPVSYEVQIRR